MIIIIPTILIITLLQWVFVVTTMVIFFSALIHLLKIIRNINCGCIFFNILTYLTKKVILSLDFVE